MLVVALHFARAGSAASVAPFFMFSTSKFDAVERDGVLATLRTHVTSNDYLSDRLVELDAELARRVGPAHRYTLPPNLRALERQAAACSGGLVIYDGEHWGDTPLSEQTDMAAAIARGKSLAKAAGCRYGVAPDGEFLGLVPKSCRVDAGSALHREVDWSDIALFNIQAQRLLSDACTAQSGVESYVRFVTTVARDVRAKNPDTKISAQVSFRSTPPDRMLAAVARLRGVVDGFYIAYPSNVGTACTYCSPQNLERVLAGLRR